MAARRVLVLALASAALWAASGSSALALPAPLAPPVVISPASRSLVSSAFVITGRVEPGANTVKVTGASSSDFVLTRPDATGATFTVSVDVPYGRTDLELQAGDGVAWSESATLVVWSLGHIPATVRSVLVDKSDFMLYVIRSGQVVEACPVATGMYGASTPVGVFHVGRPGPSPSSVWGIFRMRLYKHRHVRVSYVAHVGGRHVRRTRIVQKMIGTFFYIHGTNEPSSIGTRASHGCVRMFKADLQAFAAITARYEYVRIRP